VTTAASFYAFKHKPAGNGYWTVAQCETTNFAVSLCVLQALFEQILAGLLSRVADGNGRVQEAACSGLVELLEHAGACTHGAVLVPRMQVRLHAASANAHRQTCLWCVDVYS
jgi:hypothetical protein